MRHGRGRDPSHAVYVGLAAGGGGLLLALIATRSGPPAAAPTPTPTPSPSPSPTPTPSPSPSPTPFPGGLGAGVRVAGNTLVAHDSGAPVQLRGVNASGLEFANAQGQAGGMWGGQPIPTAATITAMQSWGINAVRVPLNEDSWLGINGCGPASAYQAAVAAWVAQIRGAGMIAIVDLHWNAPGTVKALAQQPMADADHSLTFWTSVAQTYANDPGVVFELYNEPFQYYAVGAEWSVWRDGGQQTQYLTGGQPYTVTQTWNSVGMQQMLSAIRAAGASNVVLVGGEDWCNDLTGWLANAPVDPLGNMGAAWHAYEGEAHSVWPAPEIVAIAQHYPVVVTELGGTIGTSTPQWAVGTLLPGLDALGPGIAHYTAWTWNGWCDPKDVLLACGVWDGTPSAGYGTAYRAHLLSRVGLV